MDDDGTIYYAHENLYQGVMIEVMNLLHPDVAWDARGKAVNSGMAIPTSPGGPRPVHWLSGDVFDRFGDVLRLKSYFQVSHAEDLEAQLESRLALSNPHSRVRQSPMGDFYPPATAIEQDSDRVAGDP